MDTQIPMELQDGPIPLPHWLRSVIPLTLRSKMAGNSTANAKLPASPQQSFLPSELQGTGTRSLTCVYCPAVATWRVSEESYNSGVAEVKGAARTPVKPSGSLLAAPPFSLHHCPVLCAFFWWVWPLCSCDGPASLFSSHFQSPHYIWSGQSVL